MTTTLSETAVAAAARPRRFGAWYVAEHQLRGMKAYGWTIVAGSVGNPLLYLLGIGLGLAAFLDQPIASGADGLVDYVWFVAPALLATAAVTVAMDEFTFVIMAGFKWRRIFWGMNASPVEPPQIAAGLVLSVVLRMLFTCTVYYLLILAFGAVGDPLTGALMPLVGVLGGLAFGLPLMAFSAGLTEDKGQLALVQRFVFTPLFLFSGTFFPLESLPDAVKPIAWITPLYHGSSLTRGMSLGTLLDDPALALIHVLVLVACVVVGTWAMIRTIERRLVRG